MAFRGIDIRQTGDRLLFRAFLIDVDGALVTTGTSNLYLYHLQNDGTLESYDFTGNTFKTGALTSETQALTHRTGNNGNTDTGIWTFALTTLTGFAAGDIIFQKIHNALATPANQVREFQFGGVQEATWSETTRAITDKAGFALSAGGVDAVWDEAQAGHTDSGTFGLYLDAAVSDTVSAGAGAITFTVTVQDGDAVAIPDARVWVTTDEAGTTVYAGTLTTDASGECVFNLAEGTFYLWAALGGWNITNPTTISVSA